MTIRAALLSAPAASGEGLFLRIDELEDALQLTDRHVPTVTECDRPPGEYRWIPAGMYGQTDNRWGGALVHKRVALMAQSSGMSIAEASVVDAKSKGNGHAA